MITYFIYLGMVMVIFITLLIVVHNTELKYRIVKYTFPSPNDNLYLAQYKILGVWMYIGTNRGHLSYFSKKTHCDSYSEAYDRIKKHKKTMHRASTWQYKFKENVYNNI